MKPARAAIQLSKLWRQICDKGREYPVDCRKIAEGLGVKVRGAEIDDAFEAQLRIRGDKKAIIYNENIREEGRKNFCIAHELGHHSCHADKEEYFCTEEFINDFNPHPQNIEQEANLFAATLLMPADDFRAQIENEILDMYLISTLASDRYNTSITATCKRLIELSNSKYYGLVAVKDGKVAWWNRTEEMRWTGFGFRKSQKIEQSEVTISRNRTGVPSGIWLNEKNAPKWNIFQSSVDMPYYNQTLYLIEAEPISKKDYAYSEDGPLKSVTGLPRVM